jgi:hypothetical protein
MYEKINTFSHRVGSSTTSRDRFQTCSAAMDHELAAFVAPLATQAQTLDFYDRVNGTSQSLLSGTVGPVDDLPLATAPFLGSITGSVTLDGPAGVSYDVTLNERGSGGPGIFATNVFSLPGELSSCGGAGLYCGELGNIQLFTNAKGALIGANVDVNNGEVYHTPSSDIGSAPRVVLAGRSLAS